MTLACAFSPVVDAEEPWWREFDSQFLDVERGPVTVKVIALDMDRASLRIVPISLELGSNRQLPPQVSLRDLAAVLEESPKYHSRDWIAINGGFSSYRVDVPVGLLVVNGKALSTLSRQKGKSARTGSAFAELRWPGLLCKQRSSQAWDIVAASRYSPSMCTDALQAGPVPIEPEAQLAIAEHERALMRYRRTVICMAADNRMLLVVTLQPAHLFDLAKWLVRPPEQGGAGCRVALNLSGDDSTGLAVKKAGKRLRIFGEASFPLPTALVFEHK
jgi:uncharacterized protein YigE (DUF2233 family)